MTDSIYHYCTRCGDELSEIERHAIEDDDGYDAPICLSCITDLFGNAVDSFFEMFSDVLQDIGNAFSSIFEGEERSRVAETPDEDPREEDEPVERTLACGHGTPTKIESSLSRVWCPACEDMVEAEFTEVDDDPD